MNNRFQKIKRILSIVFLFNIYILAFYFLFQNNIFRINFSQYNTISIVLDFIENIKYGIISFSILLGILFLYINKNEILDIEKEFSKEEKFEENKIQIFSKKFPLLNKIPLLSQIIRFFYKKGFLCTIYIFILFFVSSFILFHNLGKKEFQGDEYQVVSAASGYYHEGNFYIWDWIKDKSAKTTSKREFANYTRAWPHTYMIAQSYKIFGISEWSSRLVSVLWGLLFVFVSFFVSNFFTRSKKVAFLITFSLVFFPSYISLFRYTRMYAVFVPIFLILFYFGYRAITENNTIDFISKKINNFITNNLNFNFVILTIFFLFLIFNYLIHINSFVLLPALWLFFVYLAIIKKEKKYIIISLLGIAIFFVLLGLYYFGIVTKFESFFSFFARRNFVYLNYFTSYPFGISISLIFFILSLYYIFLVGEKTRTRLVYMLIFIIFSSVFFIFIGDRYAGFLYGSHITAITIISILYMYYIFIKLNKPIGLSKIYILLLIIMIIVSFGNFWIGEFEIGNGGHFREAYANITESYNPKKDVIIGQYLRTYYLRDIGTDAKIINMLNNRRYKYETFMEDIKKNKSGWVVWQTKKSYHIQKKIRQYVDTNFKKIHGKGIDNTNVEVFYFDSTMIK